MISKQAYKCFSYSPRTCSSRFQEWVSEKDNKKLYDSLNFLGLAYPTPKMGKPSKVFISESLLVYVF